MAGEEREHGLDLFLGHRANRGRLAGRALPLNQLMEEQGFTPDELRQLRTALTASDSLVKIEETAIHAVKGLYRDANGALPDAFTIDLALGEDERHPGRMRVFKGRGGKDCLTEFRLIQLIA